MPLHDGYGAKETPRRQKIVGAKSHEVVRGGPIDTLIERGVGAKVGRVYDHLHPAVVGGKRARDVQRIVRGRVIDNENAEITDPLTQYTGHASPQEAAVLVARNGDIDACHRNLSAATRNAKRFSNPKARSGKVALRPLIMSQFRYCRTSALSLLWRVVQPHVQQIHTASE